MEERLIGSWPPARTCALLSTQGWVQCRSHFFASISCTVHRECSIFGTNSEFYKRFVCSGYIFLCANSNGQEGTFHTSAFPRRCIIQRTSRRPFRNVGVQSTTGNLDSMGNVSNCPVSEKNECIQKRSLYLHFKAPGEETSCRCLAACAFTYVRPNPPASPQTLYDCCTMMKETQSQVHLWRLRSTWHIIICHSRYLTVAPLAQFDADSLKTAEPCLESKLSAEQRNAV